MFAAKGLEFPVVFVPFPSKTDWNYMQRYEIAYRINAAARTQDDGTPREEGIVLDFGLSDACKTTAKDEEFRNTLRLLYVALTRASLATYLYTQQLDPTGKISGNSINYTKSAQGVLMTSHKHTEQALGETVVEQLWDARYFAGTKDVLPQPLADWWNDLNDEGSDADKTFHIKQNGVFERHFGKRTDIGPLRREDAPENPQAAEFSGAIRDKWSIMSFSAFHNILNNRADVERETPADLDERNDALPNELEKETSEGTVAPAVSSVDLNLFRDFPHGATVGSMVHKLLENCAGHFDLFASGGQDDPAVAEAIESRIAAALREFGFDDEDETLKQKLLDGITRTLQIPLSKTNGSGIGIPLAEIRQDRMVAEMEFFLDAPDSLDLQQILSILAGSASEQARPLVGRENAPVDKNGILNGIIDLTFEHDGKYYIVDWKTNWLGASDADYTPARIRAAMGNAGYILQSYLYAAALLRFLRQRGMDYDAFGGVYYVFLRGLSRGTPNGVWFDVPPRDCLERLLSLFKKKTGIDHV